MISTARNATAGWLAYDRRTESLLDSRNLLQPARIQIRNSDLIVLYVQICIFFHLGGGCRDISVSRLPGPLAQLVS